MGKPKLVRGSVVTVGCTGCRDCNWDNYGMSSEKPMTQSAKKPLITLFVTKHEDGLQYFAKRGCGPVVMLGAHLIDKLPAILRNAAWIGATAVAYIKFWP